MEANEGSIVIFDRFPFISPLDGPEISHIPDGGLYYLPKILSMSEKKIYKNFNYLDLLIILDVNPKESIVRKPDHSADTIMSKFIAINQLKSDLSGDPDRFNWITIDSNLPAEKVFLEIQRAVWATI